MAIYTVASGDTVDTIASSYGVTADSIIYDNQLIYPYALTIGQALFIANEPIPSGKPDIQTNGYAYTGF